ncbi:MAG: M15 family metallopeptidase [Muribaculaceae bacterium]|nr:M15 family metallopeptidase [Muribaculaceae bacterium]
MCNASSQTPFTPMNIPDSVLQRMKGRSLPEGARIDVNDLRYIKVIHIGIDSLAHVGELVVNKAIADDICDIMRTLYEAKYPIESVRLIDDFDAVDEKSMSANNSSSFCYRTVSGTKKLSKHALGMAIDINPLYNPYFKVDHSAPGGYSRLEPANSAPYVDRTADFPMKIVAGDFLVTLFKKHGFSWGGDWTNYKDYQHFQKD